MNIKKIFGGENIALLLSRVSRWIGTRRMCLAQIEELKCCGNCVSRDRDYMTTDFENDIMTEKCGLFVTPHNQRNTKSSDVCQRWQKDSNRNKYWIMPEY